MIAIEMTPRTELEQLKDEYCDCHKDVYGVKARWIYGMDVTVGELKDMLASLERAYYEERLQVARNQQAAREQVKQFMALGAKDVAMAIKWMHDAHDTEGDNRFLDFELCCEYGFIEGLLKNGL